MRPLTTILIALCLIAHAAAQTKPNIVFIFTDDQQFNALMANGNELLKTPIMDQVAERGVRFTQARSALPVCSPARATILTGQFNSINGVERLGQSINPESPRLARRLKSVGYRTGVTGKWHLGKKLRHAELGFDYFATFNSNGSYYREFNDFSDPNVPGKPGKQHIDSYAVDRACDFIDQATESGQPFFLWHNSQTPHLNGKLEWDALPHNLAMYDSSKLYAPQINVNRLPKNWNDDLSGKPAYYSKIRNRVKAQTDQRYLYRNPRKLAKHTAEYFAVITELDSMLDPLFRKLNTTPDPGNSSKMLIDNTYVFFMSDNGWLMGDHGMTSKSLPFDQSSRVPFMVMGPGVDAKRTDHRQVSNIDLAPTFLEIAGAEIPDSMNGKSILSMLKDDGKGQGIRSINIVEIWERTFAGNKPILAGYDGRYELFYTYENESADEPSFVELYDQKNDRWELNNLATNSKLKDSTLNRSHVIHVAIQNHRREVLKIPSHDFPLH